MTNVTSPGSGHVVPLRGGAKLMIMVNATTYDLNGRVVSAPANPRELTNVAGFRTFGQGAPAGSFEGEDHDRPRGPRPTAQAGVRAAWAGSGTRLVIDVAHTLVSCRRADRRSVDDRPRIQPGACRTLAVVGPAPAAWEVVALLLGALVWQAGRHKQGGAERRPADADSRNGQERRQGE